MIKLSKLVVRLSSSAVLTAVVAGSAAPVLAQYDRYPQQNDQNYPNQGNSNQGYPNQSYPQQSYPNQGNSDERSVSENYPNQPQQNYGNRGAYNSYDSHAPSGYDGRQVPPPPPGYRPVQNQQYANQDRYYGEQATQWAQQNCVKSNGNTAGGAIVGGILGAIVGHSIGSRGDRGTATVAGALVGGVGGAAIGSTTGRQTGIGCPPHYKLREGVAAYSFGPEYAYAAPRWYQPWVYVDQRWVYRPYPYRAYYAQHYGYARPNTYARPDGYGRRDGYNQQDGYGHRDDGRGDQRRGY